MNLDPSTASRDRLPSISKSDGNIPIASCLDDATLVLGDLRVDQLSPMRLERRQGPGLVVTHQSAIADKSAAMMAASFRVMPIPVQV